MARAPTSADYLIISDAADAGTPHTPSTPPRATRSTGTAHAFAQSLQSRLFGSCSSNQCTALRNHVLFGTAPLKDLHPWLTTTLQNWTSTRTALHVVKPGTISTWSPIDNRHTNTVGIDGWEMTAARLDALFTWVPWGWPSTLPLVTVPNPCAVDAMPFLSGAAVLLPALPGRCSRGQAALNVQQKGGKGVVFYADVGQDIVAPSCDGKECDLPIMVCWSQNTCIFAVQHAPLQIPITMVANMVGKQLLQQMGGQQSLEAEFSSTQGPGHYVGIGVGSRVQELGWPILPNLMHLVWAAQWTEYRTGLQARLGVAADVVTVFDGSQVG